MVAPPNFFGYGVFVGGNRTEVRICFDDKVYNMSNWTPDPVLSTLPMLFPQIMVQLGISFILFFLLKPFSQPRLVAEVIAGIIIGPTLFTRFKPFVSHVFPYISDTGLEFTMSIGIVYYMFLMGLEMNLTPMLKLGKQDTMVAIAGMIVPLAVGFWSYFLLIPPLKDGESMLPKLKSAFVWAIALNATNLPDLTGTLADLKLMRTDVGRTAITSAFVSDIATWLFLVILTSISSEGYILRMFICMVIFILFCVFLARPILSRLLSLISKKEGYQEHHLQFILCGVLVWAFGTDALGLGSLVGAFMFGFSLPSGELATLIIERIEKVTLWIMVPLYCLVNGLKSNVISMIPDERRLRHVVFFMLISWSAKIVSTFLVSFKANVRRPKEVFILGVLMNSKGLLALIIINLGRDFYLTDIEAGTIMVVTILLMMMTVPLIVKYTYKSQRRMMRHKLRTIQSTGSEYAFRILTCIHWKHQVQGINSLLQMSNPTTQSKIYAIGVHLVELTEHTSAAMLVVHDAYRSKGNNRMNKKDDSDQIIEAMEELGREKNGLISVECLTAISRYATMHIDVCSIAEDKRAAFIILPFHEQAKIKNEKKNFDSQSIRAMNQQVLLQAPCTVGLLVDNGLGKPNYGMNCLIMFYIGGPDDREALAYAWRMVWRPNVHLTVVRFVQGANAVEPTPLDDPDETEGILELLEDHERQKELDEEFIGEFKMKTENNKSVSYSEEMVNSGDETLTVIRNVLQNSNYHLCIIGKGNKRISPIESGLLDLVEFRELGAIGDAILTFDFSMSASILVIQHHNPSRRKRNELVEYL